MLQRIHWLNTALQPLWNAQHSKQIEHQALQHVQRPSLMEHAGHAIAKLACAIAPHARQAWILCGPGNNGGDGLVAARHLVQRGLTVWVHWLGTPDTCSADSLHAWQQLTNLPIQWLIAEHTPTLHADDIVIDALLGLGRVHVTSGVQESTP